ncbi:MAG: CsbD family protein [Ilumatobacteraceae bacterium]
MDNTDQAKGKIKQAVGDLTDNADLKREGKADERAGKAKQAVSNVKEKADDLIDKTRDKVKGRD